MESEYAQQPPPLYTAEIPQCMPSLDLVDPYYTLGTGEDLPVDYQDTLFPCPAPAVYGWNDFQQYQPVSYPGHSSIPFETPEEEEYRVDEDVSAVSPNVVSESLTPQDQQTSHSNPSTNNTSPPESNPQPAFASDVANPYGLTGARRRKRSPSAAAAHLRHRNRVAASTYRNRQRNNSEYLGTRSEDLERESRTLYATYVELSTELAALRQLLSQHTTCNCALIQQYLLSPAASTWVDPGVACCARDRYTWLRRLSQGSPV